MSHKTEVCGTAAPDPISAISHDVLSDDFQLCATLHAAPWDVPYILRRWLLDAASIRCCVQIGAAIIKFLLFVYGNPKFAIRCCVYIGAAIRCCVGVVCDLGLQVPSVRPAPGRRDRAQDGRPGQDVLPQPRHEGVIVGQPAAPGRVRTNCAVTVL